MEDLGGLQVTSTQVRRAAAELDDELAVWRNRPLGEVTYLILDARYEKVRHSVKLVVSDDHAGLKPARHATMPGVP